MAVAVALDENTRIPRIVVFRHPEVLVALRPRAAAVVAAVVPAIDTRAARACACPETACRGVVEIAGAAGRLGTVGARHCCAGGDVGRASGARSGGEGH